MRIRPTMAPTTMPAIVLPGIVVGWLLIVAAVDDVAAIAVVVVVAVLDNIEEAKLVLVVSEVLGSIGAVSAR
jgi:hypothetical protein